MELLGRRFRYVPSCQNSDCISHKVLWSKSSSSTTTPSAGRQPLALAQGPLTQRAQEGRDSVFVSDELWFIRRPEQVANLQSHRACAAAATVPVLISPSQARQVARGASRRAPASSVRGRRDA